MTCNTIYVYASHLILKKFNIFCIVGLNSRIVSLNQVIDLQDANFSNSSFNSGTDDFHSDIWSISILFKCLTQILMSDLASVFSKVRNFPCDAWKSKFLFRTALTPSALLFPWPLSLKYHLNEETCSSSNSMVSLYIDSEAISVLRAWTIG